MPTIGRVARSAFALALALASPSAHAQSTAPLAPYAVVGDAIPAPLTGTPGDASRGRAIVASRQAGMCLLCHAGPFPEERLQGTLAPDLSGVGSRLTAAQLRLRVVDPRRVSPDTTMPAYHRIDGLVRVGPAWRGRPILSAQEVEDVVAMLATLKD